jgi:hypothetical protein
MATDRTPTHYRAQAANLRRMASEAVAPETRDQLLVLADDYSNLAERAEIRLRTEPYASQSGNGERSSAAAGDIARLITLAAWYRTCADAQISARERDRRLHLAELIEGKIEEVERGRRAASA